MLLNIVLEHSIVQRAQILLIPPYNKMPSCYNQMFYVYSVRIIDDKKNEWFNTLHQLMSKCTVMDDLYGSNDKSSRDREESKEQKSIT